MIKDRVSIDQRPAIVEEKSRIGDWEIDLVMGRLRIGALVSVVERRSRYTVLGKVPSKRPVVAASTCAAATRPVARPHKGHTETITADNGKEFAHCPIGPSVGRGRIICPSLGDRLNGCGGLNENTNGLIRQYAAQMALDTLSDEQVHHIMVGFASRPPTLCGGLGRDLAFPDKRAHEILCSET